ncbi:hypothetical protein [Enterobacter sp. BNK-34]|uniref:hypothetical protein n=1 Tax=Enterobacter sp. BNK-34 TaxID=3376171 RepID=UPI003B430A44
MSTITKEFTKEQLIEHLRSRIEHRNGLIASMHIDRGYRDYLQLELRSSEIALASLEAEPVGFIVRNKKTGQFGSWMHSKADWFKDDGYEFLNAYIAPPAPASVPDESAVELFATDLMKRIDKITGERHSLATLSSLRVSIVEACRAAMLQGADGALTNEDTKRVDELVMWIKRLAHSLRKAKPDSKLQSDAMDYLSRKGLIGVEDILR